MQTWCVSQFENKAWEAQFKLNEEEERMFIYILIRLGLGYLWHVYLRYSVVNECMLINSVTFLNLLCSVHALAIYWIHFRNVYYVFAHIRVKYSALFTCWYNFLGSQCSYKLNIAYKILIRQSSKSGTSRLEGVSVVEQCRTRIS